MREKAARRVATQAAMPGVYPDRWRMHNEQLQRLRTQLRKEAEVQLAGQQFLYDEQLKNLRIQLRKEAEAQLQVNNSGTTRRFNIFKHS